MHIKEDFDNTKSVVMPYNNRKIKELPQKTGFLNGKNY